MLFSDLGLTSAEVERFGRGFKLNHARAPRDHSKLILVTATSPTPHGEGKTTTVIGLADGLRQLGLKSVAALREPSMGPYFGAKGGATGGGQSRLIDPVGVNTHFTGDFHAITSANNLIAAAAHNHVYHGNELEIAEITWQRCLDVNDRELRKSGFVITAASETMAIFCLADSPADLYARLSRAVVGRRRDGTPVTAGAIAAADYAYELLVDALRPNLTRTIAGTPVFVHGGPFANIAHGCSSVISANSALGLADYVVTEAGFGSELGLQKYYDIACRAGAKQPSVIVLVTTVRALKSYGGGSLEAGMDQNLADHLKIVQQPGVPVVVALNLFEDDTALDVDCVAAWCARRTGVHFSECTAFADGPDGAKVLASTVAHLARSSTPSYYTFCGHGPTYDQLVEVSRRVYGVEVELSASAEADLVAVRNTCAPVCVAKTPYSISGGERKLLVTRFREYAGAGFTVAEASKTILMPGMPKELAAKL